MIINANTKQKIIIHMNYEEYKLFHKLLLCFDLGEALSKVEASTRDKPILKNMLDKCEHITKLLNEKQIWL